MNTGKLLSSPDKLPVHLYFSFFGKLKLYSKSQISAELNLCLCLTALRTLRGKRPLYFDDGLPAPEESLELTKSVGFSRGNCSDRWQTQDSALYSPHFKVTVFCDKDLEKDELLFFFHRSPYVVYLGIV